MARSDCTDPLCLIIFLLFMAGLVYITGYGVVHGDPRKLTNGIDWQGRVCGVTENVTNKPYIYWCGESNADFAGGVPTNLDLTRPICVEQCPSTATTHTFCPTGGEPQITMKGDPDGEYKAETVIKTEVKSASSYPTTVSAGVACMPHSSDKSTTEALTKKILESGGLGQKGTEVLNAIVSLAKLHWLVIGICAGGFVLSLTYLVLLRFLAKPVVYFCLFSLIVAGLGAGTACICTAYDVTGNQAWNPLFDWLDEKQAQLYSVIIGCVCLALGLLFAILTCCAHQSIQTACGCVEAACECIFGMPTMLLEPVAGAVLQLLINVALLAGFAYVLSTGQIGADDLNVGGTTVKGVSRSMSFTEEQHYYIYYYVFGIFWINEMCWAMQTFVISYAVTLWYYQPCSSGKSITKRPVLPCLRGLFVGIVWHLGSIAFGAFLLAVTRVIRTCLAAIARQADAAGPEGKAVACVAKCCMCCVTCFKKFIEFLNKNAYIDIAIKSNDFIPAAVHSFQFMIKQIASIAILNGATYIIQVAGVLSITSGGYFLTELTVTKVHRWSDPGSEFYVNEPVIVSGIAAALCFCIAIIFMVVFDQASDTLLYVYLDNKERDPKSVETYAPGTLRSLVEGQGRK
jgi:hypothetical protein